MSGARLAALKLASLGAEDRAWILQQLSARERKLIEPTMSVALRLQTHELEDIIDGNRTLFQAVSRTRKSELQVSDVETLKTANIGRIGEVLDELDPVSLALLLDSHDWPWLTVYLNWKGPETREHLAVVLKQVKGKVSSKLLELIIEKVAQKLRPERVLPDQKSRFESLLVQKHSSVVRPQGTAVTNGNRDGVSV